MKYCLFFFCFVFSIFVSSITDEHNKEKKLLNQKLNELKTTIDEKNLEVSTLCAVYRVTCESVLHKYKIESTKVVLSNWLT